MGARLLAASLVCAHLAGCTVESKTRVVGVGVRVSRMEVLGPDLREITVEDGLDLVLLPPNETEEPHLVLEGHENLLGYVRVQTGEGTLRLYVQRGFSLDPGPSIRVVASGVTSLRCIGAGAVEVLDLTADDFALDLTGSGSLRATGYVHELELNAVGSGAADLSELVADHAEVETIGSGGIRIHAEESLDVSAIGSGVVTVSGAAKIDDSVVGSGGVERADR